MKDKRTLEQQFKAIKENNKDRDWNNITQRETLVNAFRYCSEEYYEEKK